MSDVLRFVGVTVVRGGVPIVDSVDWDVAEGERWAVLGPNGAGKTTLLKIAAALEHPTRGTAEILDEPLGRTDVFELRPRIGLASAALAERLPDDERVRDAIVTASYAVTGRWRERYDTPDYDRVDDLLRALGISVLADRLFGTLSEGERKRVLVARALMPDPELLLLDEPAAGLDVGGREDLVGRLGDIAADAYAPTTVLVTHHLEEIPVGFTHALLLRAGAVVASGPIADVLTDERATAAFGVPLTVGQHDGRWSAQLQR